MKIYQIKDKLKKYDFIDTLKKILVYMYIYPLKLSKKEKEMVWRNFVKKDIKKYISFSSDKFVLEPTQKKFIFVCWLQGIENAPYIVQKCVESVKNNSGDYEVVIIDKNNYKNWIDVPSFLIKRWQEGKMLDAWFSDILRLFLLCKYGGIWIDSTVYMFDKVPNYILESERFMFQSSFLESETTHISNWFIFVKNRNDPFLLGLRDSLVEYLKKKTKPTDYYIFHDFVDVMSASEEYSEYWREIPYVNNVNPHMLQYLGNSPYDDNMFNYIKSTSPIQKLTYKLDYDKLKKNTYYDYVFSIDKLKKSIK